MAADHDVVAGRSRARARTNKGGEYPLRLMGERCRREIGRARSKAGEPTVERELSGAVRVRRQLARDRPGRGVVRALARQAQVDGNEFGVATPPRQLDDSTETGGEKVGAHPSVRGCAGDADTTGCDADHAVSNRHQCRRLRRTVGCAQHDRRLS